MPLRHRILLVEDDEDVQAALADRLREAGYLVETANDGKDAWSLLVSHDEPDLLVLDLKLPRMSGWELLERIRGSQSLITIPVLVISAHLGFPPSGALAWMKKPVDPQQLISTVQKLLR